MIRSLISLILMVVGLLVLSCSPSVYFDSSPGARFNQYRSFAMLPRHDSTAVSLFEDGIINGLIENSIVAEMKSRNLSVDTQAPDLIVKYHLLVETKEDIVSYPNAYYPGYWPAFPMRPPYYPYAGPFYYPPQSFRKIYYKEGTMIIDVFERENGGLVWRGWSILQIDNRNKFEAGLPDLISRIFSNYPVRKAN